MEGGADIATDPTDERSFVTKALEDRLGRMIRFEGDAWAQLEAAQSGFSTGTDNGNAGAFAATATAGDTTPTRRRFRTPTAFPSREEIEAHLMACGIGEPAEANDVLPAPLLAPQQKCPSPGSFSGGRSSANASPASGNSRSVILHRQPQTAPGCINCEGTNQVPLMDMRNGELVAIAGDTNTPCPDCVVNSGPRALSPFSRLACICGGTLKPHPCAQFKTVVVHPNASNAALCTNCMGIMVVSVDAKP